MRLLLKVFTKNISNKDPLSMHRTGSNETALVSEFPYMISDEHVIIALGPRKKPVFILSDEFCEEQGISLSSSKG